MDDLISRQAAIDEIARWIGYIDEDMILRIQTGLKKVPSAQPEIVHCRECIHWRYDTDHTCRYYGGASPRLAIDFCSKGERRTDE